MYKALAIISVASLLTVPCYAGELDNNDQLQLNRTLRAVKDIKRAHLRYLAQQGVSSVANIEASTLFPKYGFAPQSGLVTWKTIVDTTTNSLTLCLAIKVENSSSFYQKRLEAELTTQEYQATSSCGTLSSQSNTLVFKQTILKTELPALNVLPNSVQLTTGTLAKAEPVATFKAYTNQWSAAQVLTLVRERKTSEWRTIPLITQASVSSQFNVQLQCYTWPYWDWCYMTLRFYAQPDIPSKSGTLTLNFDDGSKGQLMLKGSQVVNVKPSLKFLKKLLRN